MSERKISRSLLPALTAAAIVAGLPVALVADEFAGPVFEAPAQATMGPPPPGVLFDQTDSPAGAAITSQVFEAANVSFDCRAADDFSVPAADVQWDISGVQVAGQYLNGGPTPLLDVEIFDDAGGLPAVSTLCSYIGLQAGVDYTDDGNGNLDVTLPVPCAAPAGDYWLSVRADMDLAVGQWLWVERVVQTDSPFAWENPGDGFGTGCVSWTAAAGCGAAAPDLIFALLGVAVPVELQSFDVD